jgi:hypothetical protein
LANWGREATEHAKSLKERWVFPHIQPKLAMIKKQSNIATLYAIYNQFLRFFL